MTNLWQKPWAPNASTTSLNNINGYYAWETPFAFFVEDIIYIYISIYLGIMFSFREGKSKKFSRKLQKYPHVLIISSRLRLSWDWKRSGPWVHDVRHQWRHLGLTFAPGGMPWNKNWRKKNKHTIRFLKALSWPIKISKIKTEDFKPSTGCLPKIGGFPPKSSICS